MSSSSSLSAAFLAPLDLINQSWLHFCRLLFSRRCCAAPRRTPLHYAAANGRYQCTVALVSAGAEVNEPDQIGCTPLHYAAASQAFSRFADMPLQSPLHLTNTTLTGVFFFSPTFLPFPEPIVIFLGTTTTTRKRPRSLTCEFLASVL